MAISEVGSAIEHSADAKLRAISVALKLTIMKQVKMRDEALHEVMNAILACPFALGNRPYDNVSLDSYIAVSLATAPTDEKENENHG